MKKTMVEVFNQLTRYELTDYSLFEDVLGNHFEKFRFFYWNTCDMDQAMVKSVKTVSCGCTETSIVITLEFTSSKNCEKYRDCVEEHVGGLNFSDGKYFSFRAETKSAKKLNITIENTSISREDDIHEDRFNSN